MTFQPFDPLSYRAEIPALARDLRPGVSLAYLDNAATRLKSWSVIRATQTYDEEFPANVHRGVHSLGDRATEAFEGARARVARFLNTPDDGEIIFTSGTTASINRVALSLGQGTLRPGEEILVTRLEHHANFLPWQELERTAGITLRIADPTPDGRLDLDDLAAKLGPRTRLVAVTGLSNTLGTTIDLPAIVALARAQRALVLVDAAQLAALGPIDVKALDIDFLAFSGHKLGGPTGVGILYGRRELLEALPPVLVGGGMVQGVSDHAVEWNDLPWKFEPGTPPIAQAIGLAAAIDDLARFNLAELRAHEHHLLEHAHRALSAVEGVRILGPGPDHTEAILGFLVDDVHPHDLAQWLDRAGVAIRAGQHCCMPLHQRLGISSSARMSLAPYNTEDDVNRLVAAVAEVRERFHRAGRRASRPAPAAHATDRIS